MSETNTGIGPDGIVGGAQTPAGSAPAAVPELERLGLHDAVELARGGFGIVYKAFQPSLNRAVAVKVMTTEVRDEMTRVRFERECKAMGMLSDHPSIVTVFDAGFTDAGRPYIVMDLMTDGALSDRLERKDTFSWREVVSITIKVAGALGTAHGAGILHRDIKPENIMMSEYGEPKLGDFGIARLQGGPETRTGTLTASIAHAAPELLGGDPPSVRTDLYALGSTMYSLLTGQLAFVRDTDESVVPALGRITAEPVPDLRTQGVPDSVCQLIERLMAKDPDERFASAEETARALQQLQRGAGLPVTTLRIPDLPVGAKIAEPDFGATNTVDVAPAPLPGAEPAQVAPTVKVDSEEAGRTDVVPSPAQPASVPTAAPRRRAPALVAGIVVLAVVAAAGAFALTRRGATAPGTQDTAVADTAGNQDDAAAQGSPIDTGQIGQQVAEIRGLSVLQPVDARSLGLAPYEELIREWSVAGREDDLQVEGQVLTALHLLPDDIDIVTFTQDLYAEQFIGFYDQRTRQVFVRSESPTLPPLERSIVVDETISALLDQNFDITARHEGIADKDGERALTTVVKGDTFLAAAVWSERFLTSEEQEQRLADLSLQPDQVASSAPQAIRADLVFPFVIGEQFVRAIFDEGGVEALNEVYDNPPTTTEQVLHPRKYLRGEDALPVEVTGDPGEGWTELTSRTFGEFDMQQLTAVLGTERSEAAAAGWGGGELKAWSQGDETAVAVSLVFDAPDDADEACAAVRDWYRETAGGSPQGDDRYTTDGDTMGISCQGDAVEFAVAPDEDTLSSLVGA